MAEADAVYSAPGKALLAGGYLVLFPQYSALSVALSSRMYAAAYKDEENSGKLTVKSPQFDSEWSFPSGEGTHENPFLQSCYEVVSKYFDAGVSGTLVIWSDSGFHSQTEATHDHYKGNLRKFSYYARPITEVPKTGLGSSAALVVSVVAAMSKLALLSSGDQREQLSTNQLHNLSQIAHCLAQKKIGSGFDVATAIYGTILYSRFPEEEIPSTLEHKSLARSVDAGWSMKITHCELPSTLSIVMGDISQGSETPGMVKNVLKWKSENPEISDKLFLGLNEANMNFANGLDPQIENKLDLKDCILKVREYLRELTGYSGVPIEPPEQQKLLDVASKIDGVVGGVVPGAGGNDAVCILIDTSISDVDTTMSKLATINGVNWIHMNLEETGLRTESAQDFIY